MLRLNGIVNASLRASVDNSLLESLSELMFVESESVVDVASESVAYDAFLVTASCESARRDYLRLSCYLTWLRVGSVANSVVGTKLYVVVCLIKLFCI
jgi:hypothetical protein